MNYHTLYNQIIINRQNNPLIGYVEKHHIIPRSLGGSDKKHNIVKLSAREHFICHLLLTKMYKEGSVEWIKMIKAFCCMLLRQNEQHKKQRCFNSRWYQYYRESFSKAQSLNQSGKGNSQFGKHWIINPITGKKKSLFPKDIQKYLEDGWIYGRSLKRPKMSLTDKTIDKMDLSEQEKQKLKQQNKEIRRQYKQKRKEELGKCYLFTNNKTGEKKIIPEKDIQQLDNNWYSPFYILDNNKKYIEQQLLHGKTIQDLTTEFNIGYDNFYSWYRKYAKDIKQKLDQQKIKKFTSICPVCGNSFINKNRRMFCSRQCWKQSMKNKCWVRKEKDLKHVNKEDLNSYLNSGWVQIIPIFNKCSDEWKVL